HVVTQGETKTAARRHCQVDVPAHALATDAATKLELVVPAPHPERDVVRQTTREGLPARRSPRWPRRPVVVARCRRIGLDLPPAREEVAEAAADAPAVLHGPGGIGDRELPERAELSAPGVLRAVDADCRQRGNC